MPLTIGRYTIVPLGHPADSPDTSYADIRHTEEAMAAIKQELEDVVLHLPTSLRDRAEEMATRECLSLNLFVLMALAEKLQRLQLQHCLELAEKEEIHSAPNSASGPLIH